MNLDDAVVLATYSVEREAVIAASILEAEGIEALVQKDDCGGAFPDLRMGKGVRLLVKSEDLEDARKIINAMDAGYAEERQEPHSLKYGTTTESGSRNGWASLATVPDHSPGRRRFIASAVYFIVGLLCGLLMGYGLLPGQSPPKAYTGVVEHDPNKDGQPGSLSYYVEDELTRIEDDRNYDGKADGWTNYAGGRISSGTSDDNFDGKPDTWTTYDNPFDYVIKVDTDFDGKPDSTIYVVNGSRQRMDWHPNDSTIIERRELYEHGVLKETLVDTDGDGKFDRKVTYDPYERPMAETEP